MSSEKSLAGSLHFCSSRPGYIFYVPADMNIISVCFIDGVDIFMPRLVSSKCNEGFIEEVMGR